jgi:phosphoribosylamine--glycine ligase
MREIVDPVIAGMASEGHPFRGFLYVGLMLTASGPKVIEFNVRLGDPETQVILPLIDQPLAPILLAAAEGRLDNTACRLGTDRVVGIVLPSRVPGTGIGQVITGVERAEGIPGVAVYHAGRRCATASWSPLADAC